MNKRIQKFAEMHGFVNEHMTPGEKSDALKKYEKFAELIVEECGVALSPMLRDMVSRGQAYNLIKQHFGVEE